MDAPLDEKAREFVAASVGGRPWRAARLLAADPDIEGHGIAPALALGDVARVRQEIDREPAAAARPDPATGWTPLHVVAASRWHMLDPARADGLLATARLLLDSGADPFAVVGGRAVLACAMASASTSSANLPMLRLLLERGAVPDDHDLYMAGFAGNAHECLPVMLGAMPDVAGTAEMALAPAVWAGDVESCRLLLEAGVDPNRYQDDPPHGPVVYASVRAGCPPAFVELLLDHGADPDAAGPDGRTPYQLAVLDGRDELAATLRARGARAAVSDADRFLVACRVADGDEARRLLAGRPDLVTRLPAADRGAALARAAASGTTAPLALMLDLGFPVNERSGDEETTALHAAAYAGSAEPVRLLLARGADVEARDGRWHSNPLDWAVVGSGERPDTNPAPDHVAVVRALLDAGSSTDDVDVSPDARKPPSPEVARLFGA